MKIIRILPTALALVAITAGAALAAQNVSTTAMGNQSCPGYSAAMQNRHDGMTGSVMGNMGNMGHMGDRGDRGHMGGNGQHMMYGTQTGPSAGGAASGTSDTLPGLGASNN